MASGDEDGAQRYFSETVEVARAASASEEEQGALAFLALLAIGRGDWRHAASLTDRSLAIMRSSPRESSSLAETGRGLSVPLATRQGAVPSESIR